LLLGVLRLDRLDHLREQQTAQKNKDGVDAITTLADTKICCKG
jgi:hypothetical protein